MNRHRRIAAWLATLALGAAGAVTLALAQQPPTSTSPPPGATPPATESTPAPAATPPAEPSAAEPKATQPSAKPAASPAPKPAAAKGSPQHFEPTEKVRPDFDVAFPIDI